MTNILKISYENASHVICHFLKCNLNAPGAHAQRYADDLVMAKT